MTLRTVLMAAAAATAVVPVAAQQPARPAATELRVLPVRGNIFLISGAGANITVSVGKDGVMLVDAGSAAMAEKTLAVIRDLSRRVTASRIARAIRSSRTTTSSRDTSITRRRPR